jgi:hypothetical protein
MVRTHGAPNVDVIEFRELFDCPLYSNLYSNLCEHTEIKQTKKYQAMSYR